MFVPSLSWCVIVALIVKWNPIDAKPHRHIAKQELPPSCESKIYCQGDLLHTIQMAKIFDDSKTFVDMHLKTSYNKTLNDFEAFMAATNGHPSTEQIKQFVEIYFDTGNELYDWIPEDFNSNPTFLNRITDDGVKQFAKDLIEIWPTLGRLPKPEVAANPEQYSLIYVPNGFIIPGGRFKEYYYWDSYWIINGLLISEMHNTARGMIENLITLVQKFGFIPNGGRIYFTQRSQPPLLAQMFWKYIQHTNDLDWLKQNIKYLDKELEFWLKKRNVTITVGDNKYELSTYAAESKGPRPESYSEDVKTAEYYKDATQQQEIYSDLKSAAQSGWDFSIRWIVDQEGGTNANLTRIATRRVIPVDLNAFLYGAFKHTSDLYDLLNISDKRDYWSQKATERLKAIDAVLWNEEDGVWYDYDIKLAQHRKYFSASNLSPLWSRAYSHEKRQSIGDKIIEYLNKNNIEEYLGGIPTTLANSGEQWDFPNAWPPLQSIVIEGLRKLKHNKAEIYAETMAKNWIKANMIGFGQTGEMFEKYDAVTPGAYGGGGEYKVQAGFGWSNGVALQFIEMYYT